MSFREVGLALRNYSERLGHLPFPVQQESTVQSTGSVVPTRTGRALYSWRVVILPYLMSWRGSWEPLQPWNSPANIALAELSSFYNFADSTKPAPGANKTCPETHVMAVTGPGTAFGDGQEPPKALKGVPASMIIVVETRASGIPWPAPGDFDIRTMPQTINAPDGKGISCRYAGGFHVIFADGKVWYLSDKVPFETLKKFFTMAEAKDHDRERLLGTFVLHR